MSELMRQVGILKEYSSQKNGGRVTDIRPVETDCLNNTEVQTGELAFAMGKHLHCEEFSPRVKRTPPRLQIFGPPTPELFLVACFTLLTHGQTKQLKIRARKQILLKFI